METEKRKSYFFVLLGGYGTEEERMVTIFNVFNEKHRDTEVTILEPKSERFTEMRTKFGINKLPGFAIADEPNPRPFISFYRGGYLMERLKGEGREFYELITDLHYSLIEEGITRVSKELSWYKLAYMFGRLWDEVKDFVTISP